jgi:hypothetical protein
MENSDENSVRDPDVRRNDRGVTRSAKPFDEEAEGFFSLVFWQSDGQS